MNKGIILLLILFCLSSFAFADSITNYVVPSNVPLNQAITATGLFDSNSGKANVVCSFYFLDHSGNLVYRATDQYTTSTGRFAMNPKVLTEPKFIRYQSYVLHTECGGVSMDANFLVDQRQEIVSILGVNFFPQAFVMDLLFFKNPENSMFMFYMGAIILVFSLGVWWVAYKFVLKL